MLTHGEFDGNRWTLRFALEADDPQRGRGQGVSEVGFKAQHVTVDLPVRPTQLPHPDAEALAIITIVKPWVGSRLHVARGVSSEFHAEVGRLFKIDIGPVHRFLKPRSQGATPLLSYSAGFDSTAASALFPDIPHLHHRRVSHPDIPDTGAYRADAIEALVTRAGERGRDVYITRTDFEHIVDPYPSLPHWFGFAVGPLLMSEHFDAGALVLGGTLETRYMDMGRRWLGEPSAESGIDPLPRLAGMPIMRPLVGVTEIGTMKLTAESSLNDLARSCVSGTVTDACHRCSKCIRKDLIRAVIDGDYSVVTAIPDDAPGWKPFDSEPPYYMQAQFEWVAPRLPREAWPKGFIHLVDKLPKPDNRETDWMWRSYEPAVDVLVPEPWRDQTREALGTRLGWMTPEDIDWMKRWDRS